MTRYTTLLLALLLAMPGCFKTFELEDEWKPLKVISERPEMLAKDTISTTIGSTLYVEDIAQWLIRHPIGTPSFISVMRHEQEHSKRQFKKGVFIWLATYLFDRSFMWHEEQRGYYLALTTPGYHYVPEDVAKNMSNYRNAAGQSMVEYEKALKWVIDVRSGQWKPED